MRSDPSSMSSTKDMKFPDISENYLEFHEYSCEIASWEATEIFRPNHVCLLLLKGFSGVFHSILAFIRTIEKITKLDKIEDWQGFWALSEFPSFPGISKLSHPFPPFTSPCPKFHPTHVLFPPKISSAIQGASPLHTEQKHFLSFVFLSTSFPLDSIAGDEKAWN